MSYRLVFSAYAQLWCVVENNSLVGDIAVEHKDGLHSAYSYAYRKRLIFDSMDKAIVWLLTLAKMYDYKRCPKVDPTSTDPFLDSLQPKPFPVNYDDFDVRL